MANHQVVNLAELEDSAPGFGVENMSFRGARDALGCEKTGLSLQSLEPGARQPFGHAHGDEEEIYVVVSGSGTVMCDDDPVAVREMDALRIGPGVTRAVEAGDDGITFLAFGGPGHGNADAEMRPGWWGDEA
jgi:mannose-6-phosphate isomerase-like protein (cupin superfamily)